MKLRKNTRPVKNRLSMLLPVLLLFLASGWNSLNWGQEPVRIENKNKDFHKYKLAKQMFEKGKQLFVKEEWAGAEKTLFQCLKLFPRYSEADYYLSRIHYKKGDWNRALAHIKKAQANAGFMIDVLVSPHMENITGLKVNYHYLHGNILFKLKRYQNARDQYLETVKLKPGHVSALLNLASTNYMLGQFQVAMDYLKRAEFLLGRTHPELKKAILFELEIGSDVFDLFRALLVKLKEGKTSTDRIRTFVSMYTKFSLRPELMKEDVLFTMYNNYGAYNVLVDFIEKIPIREPGTVMKLFDWARNFKTLNKKERALFTSLFQSLLELLSHTSKYAPNRYDYDALVVKLTDISFEHGQLYDKIFNFFKRDLNIGLNKKTLIDFVLSGINNKVLSINNIDYEFIIKDIYRKNIEEILQSQNVCSLSTLLEINRLMKILSGDEAGPASFDIGNRVIQLFGNLPFAEISKDAPKYLRHRVMPYSRTSLNKDLAVLMKHINMRTSDKGLQLVINKIKRDYLLYQLKDYLLALSYAVNAKNPKLKVFLNPNMTRLHDFENHKGQTAWNYSGPPPATDFFAGFHLSGGLSRLNVTFASKWIDHLFGRTFIYNPPHVQALLINLLDFYPIPVVDQSPTYNALLVDFGLELLRKSRDNKTMRQEVITELSGITTGYHYRKAVDYLTGRSNRHNLFLSEIKHLGENFFKKRKYLEECVCKEQLETFGQPPLKAIIQDQNRRFGNIYYRTFGNLTPQQIRIFPQDVSNVFHTGWASGEMVDEFKIKLSWLFHKKKIPTLLLGQVLYSYLNTTVPRILSQNHYRDYFSTYFVFEIFNNAHLNLILKNLQKEGYLKLK